MALSILFELFGEGCLDMDMPALEFWQKETDILFRAWKPALIHLTHLRRKAFDAVASILGLRQRLDLRGSGRYDGRGSLQS